jgi:hypothetical protein
LRPTLQACPARLDRRRCAEDGLELEVADNGAGGAGDTDSRHGLIGPSAGD